MSIAQKVLIATLCVAAGTACAQTRPATAPTTKPTAAKPQPARPPVSYGNGRLSYVADARGDRVPDFSYAGYAGGDRTIPTVPAKVLVGAPADDNTRAIQAAIDQVGKLPADNEGFRGAVLIPAGEYKVAGSLVLRDSGVVLRGSGAGETGTTLLATGQDRRTVIQIVGADRPATTSNLAIADAYVPVNAMQIKLQTAGGVAAGDTLVIHRPSTGEWVAALGMDDLGGDRHGPSWRPGSRDVSWDRAVAKIDGETVTLDAPLTMAIDPAFGGATVGKYTWPGRVSNVGVENLRIVSTYDQKNPKDEEHAWFGVGINNARDVWVRQVNFENLAGSAVAAWESSSRVTVEDCKSLHPVGEIGGLRRNTFFTSGQQVLMQRLYSDSGVHDFAVGFAAAGPNAFVQCESVHSLGESGPIDSAACGSLYDRVRLDGQPLTLRNRTYQGQGVGWASFNGVLWNSTAAVIECWRPPTAQNWAFGTAGEFAGNGVFSGSNDDVNPDSLYYAQLADRLNRRTDDLAQLVLPPVQGSRAPTLEDTKVAIEISMKPRVDMAQWADQAAKRTPIPVSTDGLAKAERPTDAPTTKPAAKAIAVNNGWIVIDGAVVTGGQMGVPWWNAGVRPSDLAKTQPALTRFVPGRIGQGLTDDLSQVVRHMVDTGQVAVYQHPPLWYERRRDDHVRNQRMDGDVVAPFYETPWARSGQGAASDGLSKWDVTKPDAWYFSRLRQFADLGAEHGLVLFNGLYMQHNVLEAGAHYADAPWRPSNNLNKVGIPEPVFFAGDKLIYVAEQFYDVTDSDRRALHRQYMRNALDQLADKPNVVFFLSEEYTGPLAFAQFWLDTVAEWQAESGKKATIALYATKDVQDAVLSDPKRSAVVSIIYQRFNGESDAGWWYQPDGKLYAPEGGKNLSPRQWSRLLKPKSAGFSQVVRAVREYRMKYPDKAFVYDGPENFAWAELIGGGSLPPVRVLDPAVKKILPSLKPIDLPGNPAGQWALADAGKNYLFYNDSNSSVKLDLTGAAGKFVARPVDGRSGRVGQAGATLEGGKVVEVSGGPIIWLTREE